MIQILMNKDVWELLMTNRIVKRYVNDALYNSLHSSVPRRVDWKQCFEEVILWLSVKPAAKHNQVNNWRSAKLNPLKSKSVR